MWFGFPRSLVAMACLAYPTTINRFLHYPSKQFGSKSTVGRVEDDYTHAQARDGLHAIHDPNRRGAGHRRTIVDWLG